MRLLREEQIMLIEKVESDSILNFISDLSIEEFIKIAKEEFQSETITDAGLKLSDYMTIEEYMDSFIDWCYGITEGVPEDLKAELSKVKGEKIPTIATLFNFYKTTDEYSDPIKDILKDPSVVEDINKLSEEAENEIKEENSV